jgi:hypothetical protein
MTHLICLANPLNLTVLRPPPSRTCALADASPMAEATFAWSQMKIAPPARKETFAKWHSSLDQAFASFHKKKAS